jgi:hypothetical protein
VWRNGEGKSYGILCLDGVLYMLKGPGSGGTNTKETRLMWSNDLGKNWSTSAVFWQRSEGFAFPAILNFGQNYEGARDNYIYCYGFDASTQSSGGPYHHYNLARVLKDKIKDISAYEYFSGLDSNNDPKWSGDITNKRPVLTDPSKSLNHASVQYNKTLKRYFFITPFGNPINWGMGYGGLAIYDAPEPWGPWTTVEYTPNWLGMGDNLIYGNIPTKWMDHSTHTFYMVFSGLGGSIAKDAYQHIKGTLVLNMQDNTPPSVPGNLQAQSLSESAIKLTWSAATDNESGVSEYRIKKGGNIIGNVSVTEYTDNNLAESTEYSYTVEAVNGVGLVSSPAGPVSGTTLADNSPPVLNMVSAGGDAARVTVVFSEPVEAGSAESSANYSINNGITVSSAYLDTDLKTVVLTVSPLLENIVYTLTVNHIRDRAQSPNTIAANSQMTFKYSATLEITSTAAASGKTYVWADLEVPRPVYIDRSYTYSTIPAKYDGLQYLQTANDDKAGTGSPFITFHVNQDVTVYVAYAGSTLPSWLAGWTDTGDDLVTTDRTLHLYSKDFAKGTVSLGNNGGAPSMYTVVVGQSSGGPVVQVSAFDGGNDWGVQVCPNPFNPEVSIRIQAEERRRRNVDIRIFNIQGNLVNILHSGFCILNSSYTWNAAGQASGIYLLQVKAGRRVQTARLMLSK